METHEVEQGISEIRRLAFCVVEEFRTRDHTFGYNADSVEWIEGFIEREREREGRDLSKGVPEGLVNTLGSFLGECVVAATGGKWVWSDKQNDWGIKFKSGSIAFPFAKVSKQLANGVQGGDSIVSFYRISIEYVAPGKLDHMG